MAKTVDLANEVDKILQKYGDDIANHIQEATKEVARNGVQAVKANAKGDFGGTGKYAKGWKSKVEADRISAAAIIYNASVPGLPHLLEHGHALRNGGRVPGRVHIKPVETELVKSFEEAVKEGI